MMKLVKFLKPFLILIIIAVVLLYVQAMADLALPDYMSDIVNVGIQQNGVDSAIPNVLLEEDMNNTLLFANSDEKKLILSNYDLIGSTSSEYSKYQETYKKLSSETIYVLKDIDKDIKSDFELLMAYKILSVAGIERIIDGDIPTNIDLGSFTIPKDIELSVFLNMMSDDQRIVMADMINQQFTSLGDKMVIQAALSNIKNKYEKLGLEIEKTQRNYIVEIGGIMLLVTLLGALCTVLVGYISARVAAGLGRNLRSKIFSKVESFSNTEIDKFSTASLITRSTNDVTQIQNLMVMFIRLVFYAPIIGIGGVIRALDKSVSMSWIIALAVAILLILVIAIFIIAMPRFKIVQKLIDKLNIVTRENLIGMMVIRAFNTQSFEEKRFDKANSDLTKNSLFINRVMVFLMPAMMLIMNGITLLIVWVGAKEIANSAMLVGDMIAFMQYALQIIFAFLMMTMMFIMIPRAAVSAQRIAEVLETEISIVDPINPQKLPSNGKGLIEFKNVSFKYPGAKHETLKNITFKAKPSETTAIIGSTGSGKTTLVNLIPRFYDVTEGEVLIDGINIKNITQYDLREAIAYIPQKSTLFSGTIESNLKYTNKNAKKEIIEQAVLVSQAKEIVDEKEEKYNHKIAQGGKNMSGGQKQRLSIARALVKQSNINLFDDSFSALDFKTDSKLRQALKENNGESTNIIVAQRISTIKNANQIIVLEDGKIVGIGNHKYLIETCSVYKEIAYSQLSKEELA